MSYNYVMIDEKLESSSSEAASELKKEHERDDEAEEIYNVDLPPQEFVFSIDHIMDSIFSLVDKSDLFACRLVSRRFRKCAQQPLEKCIQKSFRFPGKVSRNASDSSGKTLEQLTEYLEQSLAASQANHEPISFPCTHFWFDGLQLGDGALQEFFNVYGANIRKLSVVSCRRNATDEDILMDQLCNLLTEQAPKLESLFLSVDPTVEWQQETPSQMQYSTHANSRFRCLYSPLLNSDPEFQQITSRVESLPRKSNLKFLEIDGVGLAKTLECLFQLAPKLQEVVINESCFLLLLQPVNRVHLLKSSTLFYPDFDAVDYSDGDVCCHSNMEIIEEISLENNFRLRKLDIRFESLLFGCCTNLDLEERVVTVINRILQRSQETLECFTLTSVTFLSEIKIPSPMSKLKQMKISIIGGSAGATVFPIGFSLSEAFPKLASVKIMYHPVDDDDDLSFEFLNCLDFGENWGDVLSVGVKKFVLRICSSRTWITTIPPFITRRIQKLFPSAVIELA